MLCAQQCAGMDPRHRPIHFVQVLMIHNILNRNNNGNNVRIIGREAVIEERVIMNGEPQKPKHSAKPLYSRLQRNQEFPKYKYQKHHLIHQPRPGF